jgi:uncharacterized protein YkwD
LNEISKDQLCLAILNSLQLETVAAALSTNMASKNYFSYTGANGTSIGDRTLVRGHNRYFVAEQIVRGPRSLEEIRAGWKSSKGHKKNPT